MGDLKDHMIQSIANGDCSCSMSEARSMAAEVRRRRAASPALLLSESEREALAWLAESLNHAALAALPMGNDPLSRALAVVRRLLAPAGTVGP